MWQSWGSWGKVYKMFGIGEMTQSNAKGNFQPNFLRRKKKVGTRSRQSLLATLKLGQTKTSKVQHSENIIHQGKSSK